MSERIAVNPKALDIEITQLANAITGKMYALIEAWEFDSQVEKVLKANVKDSHYSLTDGIKTLINKYERR